MTRVASAERWGQQLDWSVYKIEWEERNREQQGDSSLSRQSGKERLGGGWEGNGVERILEDGRNDSTFLCCQP